MSCYNVLYDMILYHSIVSIICEQPGSPAGSQVAGQPRGPDGRLRPISVLNSGFQRV